MKIVNTKCLLLVDQNKCSRLAGDVYEYSLIIPELASETYHHIQLEFGGYFFRWVSFELPLAGQFYIAVNTVGCFYYADYQSAINRVFPTSVGGLLNVIYWLKHFMPAVVILYFCFGLVGLSGMVRSISPSASKGFK